MSVEKHDKKVALDSAITAQDYARLLSGSGDLAKRLTEAFSHSDISERKRYILMLRGFAEFMRDWDCPHEWRSKTFELALALAELDEGITPKILQPATRQDGGRPSDEWRIWIVRSRAVLALDARLRAKVALGDAVKELKKRFPSLDGEPFTKKGWLKTSIRNWRRKMGDIKPGDHLDLVAEQHEDARAKLAAMTPAEAVAVADQLLADVLH